MLVKDIGEFNLIKRLSSKFINTKRHVIAGIGDDSAVLNSSGNRLQLVTTDMLVENVHFRLSTATPFQIGWKSLAVNISDIAAMGGEPTYAFISIGLPKDTAVNLVDDIYLGIYEIADKYSVDVVGGDTVSSPQLIINIALLGEVEPESYKLRSGAKEGDYIFITGDVGGSSAGLEILERKLPIKGTDKHLMPIPRVIEGRLLSQSGCVNAMIDVSDGVSSEIYHICEQSRTGAKIFMKDIPLSDNTYKVAEIINKSPYDFALYGGEDYELLFTCRPDSAGYIKELIQKNCSTPITCIGYITDSSCALTIENENGVSLPLKPAGYNHFVE